MGLVDPILELFRNVRAKLEYMNDELSHNKAPEVASPFNKIAPET